jgi:hypothetical protein
VTPVQLCQRDCGDSQGCVWSCDGVPDSITHVDISLYVTDNCDDNYPLVYRFFDRASGEVWPNKGVYETEAVGVKTINEFTAPSATRSALAGLLTVEEVTSSASALMGPCQMGRTGAFNVG